MVTNKYFVADFELNISAMAWVTATFTPPGVSIR